MRGKADNVLRFTVPGPPVPCERPRVVRKGDGRVWAFTPQRTERYEATVGLYAMRAMSLASWVVGGEGPFAIVLYAYREARRGDADNIYKTVADSLTKARVWADDRYVEDVHVRMFVDKANPRIEVMVHDVGRAA